MHQCYPPLTAAERRLKSASGNVRTRQITGTVIRKASHNAFRSAQAYS